MRRIFLGALAAAIVSFISSPALACDLCSIYAALDARESHPGWYASLFEQYSDFSTLQEEGDEVHNEVDQSLESSISQLIVGYQFNGRWGVQVNVPVIDRSFERPEGEILESGSESGMGDVTLLAHWRAFERLSDQRITTVTFLAGIKAPTGSSDRLAEEASEEHHEESAASAALTPKHEGEEHGVPSGLHGHDLSLGSGSTDGVLGASLFSSWNRWYLQAQTQYTLRTEGDFDYRFANELSWSVSPGYFIALSHGQSVGVGVQIYGEKKGEDELNGARLDDTALDAVYGGPTFSFSRQGRWLAELAVDLPLSQENSALQLVPDFRARLGLTWRFGG